MRTICVPLFAVLASVFLAGAGCSKTETTNPQLAGPGGPVPEPATVMSSSEYEASLPIIGGTEGYAGSESCRECHVDQFQSWHRSYHRTMTQLPSPDSVKASFDNVTLTNNRTEIFLSHRGGEYWARFSNIDSGEALEVRMGLVTGSHHMQVFWVPEGSGNLQIGFPFTWLIPEQRWVPRNSTFIRPPDMAHRSEAWNIVCSRCHTTGVEPHVDMAARRIETRVAELGISCEACHGPAKHHVDAQLALRNQPGPKTVAAGEILHPEKIDPVRASQVCGFCHSMKWIDKSENWRESGFRYRPGDDLDKTTPVIRPSKVGEIQELADYLQRNTSVMQEFFWPDGMIRVSGREYNGLIESPCYKGGKFSCLSCHSLHESDPDDMLKLRARSNQACVQCHDKYAAPDAAAAHSRHSAESSGSECYNCHMPHTTYGVLKAIRSHQVSSPRLADELATGRPNACNLCHMDKPLNWAADHLQAWFRQEKPALKNDAAAMSRMVQLSLTGDAGQRALAAWHLGWEPALRASGTNWTAAILGELLDDPYAAVRLVAERSLKSAAPQTMPPTYDYTVEPLQRPRARTAVWEKWSPSGTANPMLLLDPQNLPAQAAAFEEKLIHRDPRPMRLRE